MAILTKQPRKQVIDLTGPQGNAFMVDGYEKLLANVIRLKTL